MTDWRYCQPFQSNEGLVMLVDNRSGKWELGYKITTLIEGNDLIVERETDGRQDETNSPGTDKVS